MNLRKKYFLLLLSFPLLGYSQESIPGKFIICHGSNTNNSTHTIPNEYTNASRKSNTGKSSNFEITYTGFSEEAKKAFQYAIETWQSELHSDVTIRLGATWTSLENNFLATTRPTKLYRGFEDAVQPTIWYPVALAEKIAGRDLNEKDANDIEISINGKINWYYGTDGNTTPGHIDLVSVVLHEIAHGIGFSSSSAVTSDKGSLRDENYLNIYDVLIENNQYKRLSSYPDPSATLKDQFTNNRLHLYSPTTIAAGGIHPKIFAPNFFIAGTSISHLDESEYPEGDSNSLMSPYFSMGESIHTLGTILSTILNDLGWGDSAKNNPEVIPYPNPSSGIFDVLINMPITVNEVDITIFDLTGREVLHNTIPIALPNSKIDLSACASGVYTLIVSSTGTRVAKKIIVMK